MKGTPANIIAACFAMAAFGIAIIAGLLAANETMTILVRAIGSMFVCYLIGMVVGSLVVRAVDSHLQTEQTHPHDPQSAHNPSEKFEDSDEDVIVV